MASGPFIKAKRHMARLLSVNVGLPRDIEWKGRIVHTAIWKNPSGIAAHWKASAYQSILELAEACDVPVRWSCRTGVCHNCGLS